MHGPHHTGDKSINSIALLNQRDQSRYLTLIVITPSKMSKDQFLETIDLVLQRHQITDRLVTLIGIVNVFQRDIFFIFEKAVEFGMVSMESQFGEDEGYVGSDERGIASNGIRRNRSGTGLQPARLAMSFFDGL